MPDIVFSQHALDQFEDRGASKDEVKKAILEGEKTPAICILFWRRDP